MPVSLDKMLVIGISSRALFDLEAEEQIYQQHGLEDYRRHQLAHENTLLRPGAGFALVRALLKLNQLSADKRLVEVVVTGVPLDVAIAYVGVHRETLRRWRKPHYGFLIRLIIIS